MLINKVKVEEEWKCQEKEGIIMHTWDLNQNSISTNIVHKNPTSIILDKRCPPPTRFIKFNFDGVSRGNSGMIIFGDLIQNERGEMVWIYAGSLGA